MGFISRLQETLVGGSKKTVPVARATAPVTTQPRVGRVTRNAVVRNNWLTLTHPNFFGRAHHSPNKRWIAGCNDSDGVGRGGYRERGNGRVILVDSQLDKVMHELTCFARPMDAAVSDAGTYIVHDSGFGSALQGDVIALDVEGHERHRRHYSANVLNVGLSKCGRYAAVQTCNAPSDDGNLLEVLDFDRGCAVFSVRPTTGWADKYLFDVDAKGHLKAIGVEHRDLGRFSYSASGEFQDTQTFQAARLDKGDYSTKLMGARDLLKADPTQDNARKALTTANVALAEGAKDMSDWGAIAHRIRGDAYEVLGQLPEALIAFDQALSLNPKVGVQKRAVALRKKLGRG